MINSIRDEDKHKFGIYGIRNIIVNKYYIGQTSESFQKRFNRHNNNLMNHRHHNEHLQKSYDKYGTDSFEFFVIEVKNSIDDLDISEQRYISEYRSKFECYNVLSGGPVMAKENNPMYGKHLSENHKKKISLARKGLSAGCKNYFYGKDHSGKNNGFYGRKHTKESRKKMSETKSKMYKGEGNPFYGKHHSEESLKKMKNNSKNAMRKVMCIETGVIYDSIKNAAKETNTCARSISAVCNGVRNVANGLHWKHMSDRSKPLYKNVSLSMDDET